MKERLEHWSYLIFFTVIAFVTSCIHKQKDTLFTQLSSAASGIHFSNDVDDNDSSSPLLMNLAIWVVA